MGKIFNVVLNSAVDSAGGIATNNENFYYDFSTMDEGKYKVTWSFMSAVNSVLQPTGVTVPNVFIDLGQGQFVNIASSSNVNQGMNYNATFIGSLEFKSFTTPIASYGYYSATTTTNPPFYLDNKPRNNLINVLMFNNNPTISILSPVSGQYTLILSFEKQPDEINMISYKPSLF